MQKADEKKYFDQYENEISLKEKIFHVSYRVVILVLIGVIIWLAWSRCCVCDCNCNAGRAGLGWDDNISWDDDSKKADQQALNDKVAEGMITVSMNADPILQNKKAKGNFNFENYGGNGDNAGNIRPLYIELYLKDDVEKKNVLYRSGKIPVGAKIKDVALTGNTDGLGKGTFRCVAYFNSVNENDEVVGVAAGECTLHIVN